MEKILFFERLHSGKLHLLLCRQKLSLSRLKNVSNICINFWNDDVNDNRVKQISLQSLIGKDRVLGQAFASNCKLLPKNTFFSWILQSISFVLKFQMSNDEKEYLIRALRPCIKTLESIWPAICHVTYIAWFVINNSRGSIRFSSALLGERHNCTKLFR